MTILPAPASWLRGHPKVALDTLLEARGSWNPHLLHRSNRTKPGVWGRWTETSTEQYGFSPVKAFWFDGKKVHSESGRRDRQPGQAVMLHFHGGGYLCGTAAETDLTSGIPKHLVVHSPIHHVLSVDYRLAPKAPWPLPLLDAISAYHHLVHDERVDEKDIVLVGDSAGGHLAIALTRWIRDEGKAVGLNGPRGLVVMSPWADVGFTNAWGDGLHYNADCDSVSPQYVTPTSLHPAMGYQLLFSTIGKADRDRSMTPSDHLLPHSSFVHYQHQQCTLHPIYLRLRYSYRLKQQVPIR